MTKSGLERTGKKENKSEEKKERRKLKKRGRKKGWLMWLSIYLFIFSLKRQQLEPTLKWQKRKVIPFNLTFVLLKHQQKKYTFLLGDKETQL